jgi:DNA-binding MarR family transcriptional regulator
MNAHFFCLKRAYHGFLRVTRRPLQVVGLTAARYDMMYALKQRHHQGYFVPMLQSELRKKLGVNASVVSRMLRSLERLGLLTRKRPERGDKRQRQITLTEKGLACIRYAYQAFRRSSVRLLCIAIALGKYGKPVDTFFRMLMFEDYLLGMRHTYGDTAALHYFWHPDD